MPDGVCNPVRNFLCRTGFATPSGMFQTGLPKIFVPVPATSEHPDGIANPVRQKDGVCNPVRNVSDRVAENFCSCSGNFCAGRGLQPRPECFRQGCRKFLFLFRQLRNIRTGLQIPSGMFQTGLPKIFVPVPATSKHPDGIANPVRQNCSGFRGVRGLGLIPESARY